MQSVPANRLPSPGRSRHLLPALALVTLMVFAYLPALGVGATLVVALATAVPVVVTCYFWLVRSGSLQYLNMALGMFALGGIGMLLGCTLDFGPLGLYGLLSLCQNLSLDVNGLAWYWQKLALSPWTYTGMLLGSNLGMWLFRRDNGPDLRSGPGLLRIMLVCNLGMLVGMAAGEALVIPLVSLSSQPLAMGLMVVNMLLTMTVGMLLALWCHARLGKLSRAMP